MYRRLKVFSVTALFWFGVGLFLSQVYTPAGASPAALNQLSQAVIQQNMQPGRWDTRFFLPEEAYGAPRESLHTADGQMYINGASGLALGLDMNGVSKWDGTSWDTLQGGVDGLVYDMVLDSQENLYVAGTFTQTVQGLPVNYIAKWDGTNWSALGAGLPGKIESIGIDGQDNIYASVYSSTTYIGRVFKWDGTAWSQVGPDVGSGSNRLAVDANGVVYSYSREMSGGTIFIVKWDGSNWVSIGNTAGSITHMAVDELNQLYLVGSFSWINNYPNPQVKANKIAKWDGTTWSALGNISFGSHAIESLLIVSSQEVYVGGNFSAYLGAGIPSLANLAKWDGQQWGPVASERFSSRTYYEVHVTGLGIDTQNRVWAAGWIENNLPHGYNYLFTWNNISENWETWVNCGLGLLGYKSSMLHIDHQNQMFAISDGQLWYSTGCRWQHIPGLSQAYGAEVTAMAVNIYGHVYVATKLNSTYKIIMWDGQTWHNIGEPFNSQIYGLVIDNDGYVYANGFFTHSGSTPLNYVARWDGVRWQALDGGTNNAVYYLKHNPHTNDLYAFGAFTLAGSTPVVRWAKWDGFNWASVPGTLPAGSLRAIHMSKQGHFYALTWEGVFAGIYKFHKWDGNNWTLLATNPDMGASIYDFVLDNQERVIFWGRPNIPSYPNSQYSLFTIQNGQFMPFMRYEVPVLVGLDVLQLDNSSGLWFTGTLYGVGQHPNKTPARNLAHYIYEPDFSTSAPTALGATTYFTVTTPEANTTYSWDFGDGQTAGGETAAHTYPTPGKYFVTLTAAGPAGVISNTISIWVQETLAGLTIQADSPIDVDTPTLFTASLTAGSHETIFWDFGNGQTAIGSQVMYSYPNSGSYTITVSAKNQVNQLSTSTQMVVMAPPPDPITGLTLTAEEIAAVQTPVLFSAATQTGSDVIYSWDFGDGTTAAGAEIDHTYLTIGQYTVTVTATNAVNQLITTTTILVAEPLSQLTVEAPSLVAVNSLNTFTAATQTGNDVTYSWDFGDGTTATEFMVEHAYTAIGQYTVTVTATNALNQLVVQTAVMVEEPISELAITAPAMGAVGQEVAFSASIETGSSVSYLWDFGNGATAAGVTANYTYTQTGSYTVTLTAENPLGQLSTTTQLVVVEPITGLTLTAPSPVATSSHVTLTAAVNTGSDVIYSWDLGDGNTATGTVVTHIYPAADHYTITVTAANPLGQLNTTTQLVVVEPITGLTITAPSAVATSSQVTLTAAVNTGSNVIYSWDLGDGNTATGNVVTHIYPAAGHYTITVTAANELGQETAVSYLAVVDGIGQLHLTAPDNVVVNEPATFTVTASAGDNIVYSWDFGDEKRTVTSQTEVMVHTFTAPGSYTITITAQNEVGEVTIQQIIVVQAKTVSYKTYLPVLLTTP